MADDLGRYLAGEPVAAKPPTLTYFVAKRVSKHRAALTLATLVAAGLLAVVVGAYVRVDRARQVAVAQGKVAGQQRALAEEQRVVAETERRRATEKEAQAVEASGRAIEASKQAAAAEKRAEVEWADGLVAQADAKAEAGRWPEAVDLYEQACGALAGQGRSTMAADSGLLAAWRRRRRRWRCWGPTASPRFGPACPPRPPTVTRSGPTRRP